MPHVAAPRSQMEVLADGHQRNSIYQCVGGARECVPQKCVSAGHSRIISCADGWPRRCGTQSRGPVAIPAAIPAPRIARARSVARGKRPCYTGGMITLAVALSLALQTGPVTNPPPAVDASTLHKKVLCGYQGWFRAAGDGGSEWDHWNRDWNSPPAPNTPGALTFDLWPETREYDHQYAVPGFTRPDGSPAFLYSAADPAAMDKHFDWLRDYGLDGVVLQRFVTQLPPDNVQAWKSNVLHSVRAAANRTGRVFCLEYDLSGAARSRLFSQLTNDWIQLARTEKLTQDPRYLHENGRPVLFIFGFYPERFPDPALPKNIIAWFKTNPVCPVTLIGSGWWNWRAGATGEWTNIYRSFHGYCPWNTGNYTWVAGGGATNKYAATGNWPGDAAAAKDAGMFLLPQLYPGFSWDNLQRQPPGTSKIPRLGGDFLWKQFYDAARAGLDMAYVGMFDEVDEGTAIFKVTSSPPIQGYFATYEGLPPDWYLRLTAEGAKMLRGESPIQRKMPLAPPAEIKKSSSMENEQ